jgi:hypothetical protein
LIYDNAFGREHILTSWYELVKLSPVNWKDKESIKRFRIASDAYAKTWSRLDYEEQGWISEQILNNVYGR